MQGSYWIIIGYIIMAAGLLMGNYCVYRGNKLIRQQDVQTILAQQKESELEFVIVRNYLNKRYYSNKKYPKLQL